MIQKFIQEGESKTVEFKVEFPQNNQISQTVCAFSNRAGGYIIIGVTDDGVVIGLARDALNEYIEKIPNIIHDSIFPMIIPEIYTYTVEQKNVLVIQVFPGSNMPYYIKNKGKLEGTYVRVGRTNKIADVEMVKELERQKLNKSFDEDIYEEVKVADIEKLVKILESQFHSVITKEKLLNLKMIEFAGDREYLTNAGAVILGKISNTTVKCAKFLGESVVDFIDKKEYSGDLFQVLDEIIAFIKNHLLFSGLIQGNGLRRKDILEIPEEVLREGVINALMHRDYSMLGADIKIAIFDSKIEITSPGGLPKSLTVEDIYAGRSEIRNRVLSNIFLKLGYVEQWGSGIPRMRELCRNMGLKEPEIQEKGLFVILRVFRKSQMTDKHNYAIDKTKLKSELIQEEQQRIYAILRQDNQLTVKEIANIMEKTEASVQRRLKSMQENGTLIRIGSKKSGYWELID